MDENNIEEYANAFSTAESAVGKEVLGTPALEFLQAHCSEKQETSARCEAIDDVYHGLPNRYGNHVNPSRSK